MVPIGFTRIQNCINFGNIICYPTAGAVGGGGILGGVPSSSAGQQFQIINCTNYGNIDVNQGPINICGIGGIISANVVNSNLGVPISPQGVSTSDCYYWNWDYTIPVSVGTKVNSSSESIVTSMRLSSDLFIPQVDAPLKVDVYPPESFTTQYTESLQIDVPISSGSIRGIYYPYNTNSTFDSSDPMVNSKMILRYPNRDALGENPKPIETYMYYRRWLTPPPKPDDTFDVWDGQIVSDPFTGGPDADGWYVIDSAAKMGAFTAKTNYQAYPGWTAFPETYVKVKVTKNIDMNNISFYPFGVNISNPWEYVFDGDGHTIKGLNIAPPNVSQNENYIGLFSIVNARIKNLVVEGSLQSQHLCVAAGGLIGNYKGSELYNIVNKIQVTGASDTFMCGGICGIMTSYGGVIQNCVNMGTITNNCSLPAINTCVGGIIGYMTGDSYIDHNVNMGQIGCAYGDTVYIGGIVGSVNLEDEYTPPHIKQCISTGALVNSNYELLPSDYVDGVVGKYNNRYVDISDNYYYIPNGTSKTSPYGTLYTNTDTMVPTAIILNKYLFTDTINYIKATLYPDNIDLAKSQKLNFNPAGLKTSINPQEWFKFKATDDNYIADGYISNSLVSTIFTCRYNKGGYCIIWDESKTSGGNYQWGVQGARISLECKKDFLFDARSVTNNYNCFIWTPNQSTPLATPINLKAGETYIFDISGAEPKIATGTLGFTDMVNLYANGEVIDTTWKSYDFTTTIS